MKKFVLLVLVLITGLTVFSQGIEFQKGRYAEAVSYTHLTLPTT